MLAAPAVRSLCLPAARPGYRDRLRAGPAGCAIPPLARPEPWSGVTCATWKRGVSSANRWTAQHQSHTPLNLRDEIEDILLSLSKQYHLLRPVRTRPGLFYYLAIDRQRSNLAMARYVLSEVERELPL